MRAFSLDIMGERGTYTPQATAMQHALLHSCSDRYLHAYVFHRLVIWERV